MAGETIKTYQGSDAAVSQCLVALENFIGDVDGETLASDAPDGGLYDEGTVDASDAVTAINGLIFALEQQDALRAEVERLTKERDEWTARAVGATWLIPDETTIGALRDARDRAKALIAERDRMKEALREVEVAEREYRRAHDTLGGDQIATGRAWDRLRRAGDKARAALNAEKRDGGEG